MREIKYRGKKISGNGWVYGYLTKEATIEGAAFIHPNFYHTGWKVDRKSVGEFTGFKDKKGREIYEGDIIKLTNEALEEIKVVCKYGSNKRYVDGRQLEIIGFYFEGPNGFKSYPVVENYLGKHDTEIFEVIGNTFDNPEIL